MSLRFLASSSLLSACVSLSSLRLRSRRSRSPIKPTAASLLEAAAAAGAAVDVVAELSTAVATDVVVAAVLMAATAAAATVAVADAAAGVAAAAAAMGADDAKAAVANAGRMLALRPAASVPGILARSSSNLLTRAARPSSSSPTSAAYACSAA